MDPNLEDRAGADSSEAVRPLHPLPKKITSRPGSERSNDPELFASCEALHLRPVPRLPRSVDDPRPAHVPRAHGVVPHGRFRRTITEDLQYLAMASARVLPV